MRKSKLNGGLRADDVTVEDVMRLFQDVDAETVLAILELRPSIADLEEAALRLIGDDEAVGRRQATGTVARILDLVEPDQEQRPAIASPNQV
ncbi:MAG TPA: hypothetical protein VH765_02960 [Xanthobacteraceae bacterium]|jgi:hypothetical protein